MTNTRRRKSILDRLDDATRQVVEHAIKRDPEIPAAALFKQFELQRFDITLRSFRDHVRRRRSPRKPASGRKSSVSHETRSVTAAKGTYVALMLRILHVVHESLSRDDLGDLSRLAAILQAINSSIRLIFAEATNDRAADIHRIKLEKLKDDLHREISEKAETQTCMTEAEARDMIDRIMREN